MLAIVADILREQKLLEKGDEPIFNISLISGEQLNLQAFTHDGAHFHTRVKQRGVVPAEYEKCCKGWRSFPQYAPEPLGRYFRESWEIILVQGVSHRPVSLGDIARNRQGLVQELIGFFAASREAAHVAQPMEPHRAFLRRVQERAADQGCATIVNQWLAVDELDRLPHIAQHGDLVVNNLGLRDSGLVVFDWEDFGRVALPGLDLCTVVASDCGLNPERLRAVMQGAGPPSHSYQHLLRNACPAIGLTPELFRRLIPLYLAIFLDLKRDYGDAIRAVVRKLIREVRLGDDTITPARRGTES